MKALEGIKILDLPMSGPARHVRNCWLGSALM